MTAASVKAFANTIQSANLEDKWKQCDIHFEFAKRITYKFYLTYIEKHAN